IGVGVSFGGDGGDRRGLMVSLTLAIHNIPEGLASVEDTENKLATAVSLVLAFVSMLNIQYVLTGEL
ncbi:hypothetical protein DYB26_015947, partial [Aphanomyces astaci]